jgi:diacylglycerol kinase
MQIHLVATALVVGAAVYWRVSPVEWAILALTIGLVLALEAMNSAVEATIDAFGQPPSTLAKRAKDAAAGSVLLGAIIAVVVAAAIFGPRLLSRG